MKDNLGLSMLNVLVSIWWVAWCIETMRYNYRDWLTPYARFMSTTGHKVAIFALLYNSWYQYFLTNTSKGWTITGLVIGILLLYWETPQRMERRRVERVSEKIAKAEAERDPW